MIPFSGMYVYRRKLVEDDDIVKTVKKNTTKLMVILREIASKISKIKQNYFSEIPEVRQ
jgi:hypothetical protein